MIPTDSRSSKAVLATAPGPPIPGAPIAVTDLDVLAILDSLLVLHFRDHSGAADTRRLSYRNVDVEQIGHIYERLLDHDAVTADTVVLGLVGKPGEEPEIPLPELELKMLSGRSRLAAWLSDKDAAKAGRRAGTLKQVEKLLDRNPPTVTFGPGCCKRVKATRLCLRGSNRSRGCCAWTCAGDRWCSSKAMCTSPRPDPAATAALPTPPESSPTKSSSTP